ncbi:hypothetical protein IHE45_09G032500 [Dioscorea alata]|uniref:Uncharacterized protein n=1 Tax=Dioscorea alata TaxID=55571 RepID=A0ACB7VEJ2_DIOAL|nr:hypothetical protein IHE45_09G032500 [Dioscorea alata]
MIDYVLFSITTTASTLVNARCYLAPVVETLTELKKEINRCHWEILRRTLFSHIMDVALVKQERGVFDVLLQVYDDGNQWFRIVESTLPFREEDVALILGLRCNGDIVSFKHERDQSMFEQTFLNKMHNRHSDAIKVNLFKLVGSKDDEEETFLKLLIVYFMMTIFFPNTSQNAPRFTATHTNDLTSLGRYSWTHAFTCG